MPTRAPIRRHHHITLWARWCPEDYDFHTKVCRSRGVKKTALIRRWTCRFYHLYFGQWPSLGEGESTLVTTFRCGNPGARARRRKTARSAPSKPVGCRGLCRLGFWHKRLADPRLNVRRDPRTVFEGYEGLVPRRGEGAGRGRFGAPVLAPPHLDLRAGPDRPRRPTQKPYSNGRGAVRGLGDSAEPPPRIS